jgi:hypothetical protein
VLCVCVAVVLLVAHGFWSGSLVSVIVWSFIWLGGVLNLFGSLGAYRACMCNWHLAVYVLVAVCRHFVRVTGWEGVNFDVLCMCVVILLLVAYGFWRGSLLGLHVWGFLWLIGIFSLFGSSSSLGMAKL